MSGEIVFHIVGIFDVKVMTFQIIHKGAYLGKFGFIAVFRKNVVNVHFVIFNGIPAILANALVNIP